MVDDVYVVMIGVHTFTGKEDISDYLHERLQVEGELMNWQLASKRGRSGYQWCNCMPGDDNYSPHHNAAVCSTK